MKYEIKVEYNQNPELERVIRNCYFDNNNGKLCNTNYSNYLEIEESDPTFIIFKGLSNMTVRITNNDMIDGIMRFVIEESNSVVKLIPCSIYCIIENDKYSFY